MVIGGMSASVGSGPVVSAGVTPAFSARVTGTIERGGVGGWVGEGSRVIWGGGCRCNDMCIRREGGREQLGRVVPRQLL